jgi:hypothetical protein
MRALSLLLLVTGCTATPVNLSFSGQTTTQVGSGYTNTQMGKAVESETELVLTSSAGGASLRIQVDPVKMPAEIKIGDNHLSVEYALGASGWSSNGGSITVSSVGPYDVTFNGIEMRAASPGAKGVFVLGGTASFTK